MLSLATCIHNDGDEYNKGRFSPNVRPVAPLDSCIYVLTCANPESLSEFFFFFFFFDDGQ